MTLADLLEQRFQEAIEKLRQPDGSIRKPEYMAPPPLHLEEAEQQRRKMN